MANETVNKSAPVAPAISKLTEPVIDSVREVLYAGLGVFSIAQQEGGRLVAESGKLFDKLIIEGGRLEKKTFDLAETTVGDIRTDVESRLEEVRKQAVENLGSFSHQFDEQVAATLDRLGIPTTKDLGTLSGRVQQMTRQAGNNWKKFESILEKRIEKILENLGELENSLEDRVTGVIDGLNIPSNNDIGELSDRLEKLTNQVHELEKQLKTKVEASDARILTAPENKD